MTVLGSVYIAVLNVLFQTKCEILHLDLVFDITLGV